MTRSERLFEEAVQVIPGGVNSPVRAFHSIGGTPRFIKRAKGACMYDEDDNCYIDFVGSWGPMILGHSHKAVVDAVIETCQKGLSFGAATAIVLYGWQEDLLAEIKLLNLQAAIMGIQMDCWYRRVPA